MALSKEEVSKIMGSKIRSIRHARNLSIEKVALDAGMEYTQLSRIERGKINTSVYHTRVYWNLPKEPNLQNGYFRTCFTNPASIPNDSLANRCNIDTAKYTDNFIFMCHLKLKKCSFSKVTCKI
ncbi:MAG: helix-turn-helix transcriptional regulator [Ferruginibacter sp.]|nr:helix-turn-helix transcriptional regulator [Ferruginibacter sp.]